MKLQHKAILMGLFGGVLYWLLDSTVDWLLFYEGSFLNLLILDVPGHELWMRVLGLVLFIGFGLVVGVFAKKGEEAEQALWESEASSRSIIESSPLGMLIYELEADGRLIFRGANPAAAKILGVDKSELIGQEIEQVFPPLAQSELPQIYRQVAAEGKTWQSDEFAYDDGQIKGLFEVHAFQISPGKMVAVFSDVTERKRIQEEISRLAKFPSENPNPVLRISRDGTVLYSNQASVPLLQAWDYQKGQPISGEWRKFVSAAIGSGHSQKTELKCDHQIFSLTFAPVVESDYVNVYALDIADRKKAEESLQAREADQALILRSVPIVLYSAEVSGEFASTWLSGRVEELTGIPGYRFIEEENLWASRLHPDDKEMAIKKFKGILSTDSFVMEYRWQHVDGSYIWFLDQAMLLRNEQGHPKEIIGTWVDITERKQAEQLLEESEARYKDLYNNAPDMFVSVDAKTAKIIQCNQIFLETMGYTKEEVIGRPVLDMYHPDSREDTKRAFESFTTTGEIHSAELQLKRKDGTKIEISLKVTAVRDEQGNILQSRSVCRDITERKQAEERLRFTHRFLEISNRHLEMKPLLKEFVAEVKDFAGCAAVGIRLLDEDGNIPYESYQGFSRKFYESESFLSIKNHQCMCTKVITGKVDLSLPCYTEGGSFCINAATNFLEAVPPQQKGRLRSVCHDAGYESLALFPIRLGGRVFGLIHIADPRENAFPPEMVETLESAAIQLGTAIQRVWSEETLRKSKDELEIRVRHRTADLVRTVDDLETEVKDRILAEEKLNEEQRRLYSVFQMLPGYVILHGLDHKVRFANDRFLELFGEPGDRLCYEIMRRQDQPCDTCETARVLDAQALHEWEWTCPDGKTYHVWGYPFIDVDQTQVMLELGIDVTERKNLETEVLRISETERQRIGQDLHDSLSQTLSGISCLSQVLHNKLAAKSMHEAADAKKIELLITDSVKLTQSLARGLTPVGVEPEGLMNALKDLASNVESMFNIQCIFQCDQLVLVDDKLVATHLYRIAQEAINNAVRHGQAQNVIISLALSKGYIALTIKDDGLGLPDDISQSKGLGLRIMNYRAHTIGASLSVQAGSKGGTSVICRLKQKPPTESQE